MRGVSYRRMSRRPPWIDELFKAIDARDAERFASFVAPA